jgi:hypothetical protein
MLTRKTEKEWTAEVLKKWLANKNRDFREHEGEARGGSGSERKKKVTSMGTVEENRILK